MIVSRISGLRGRPCLREDLSGARVSRSHRYEACLIRAAKDFPASSSTSIQRTADFRPCIIEKFIVVAVQFVYSGIILDGKSGGLGIYPQKRTHLIFGNCRESIDVGQLTNSV